MRFTAIALLIASVHTMSIKQKMSEQLGTEAEHPFLWMAKPPGARTTDHPEPFKYWPLKGQPPLTIWGPVFVDEKYRAKIGKDGRSTGDMGPPANN